MTNSPLIDRKIEEAYGIIRETSEKKKDRVEKESSCRRWLRRQSLWQQSDFVRQIRSWQKNCL